MGLAEDTAFVGVLLDAYAKDAHRWHVAAKQPEGRGVPPVMHAGPVDKEGWVEWRMLPSTLTEPDVAAVEREFSIEFPPLFRAFLLARFHLFDQVASRKYDGHLHAGLARQPPPGSAARPPCRMGSAH